MIAIFRRKNISAQSTVSVLRNSSLISVPMPPPTFLLSHNFHTALFTSMLLELHTISSAVFENHRQENNDLRFLEHNATHITICYIQYHRSYPTLNVRHIHTYWNFQIKRVYNSYQVMDCIIFSIPRMILVFKGEVIQVIKPLYKINILHCTLMKRVIFCC